MPICIAVRCVYWLLSTTHEFAYCTNVLDETVASDQRAAREDTYGDTTVDDLITNPCLGSMASLSMDPYSHSSVQLG